MPRDDWIGGKGKNPEEAPTTTDPMHIKIFNYQPEIYEIMREYDKMMYIAKQAN